MSVLIRCHNQAGFLPEAVESVLRQTRPPDEIIVVDDGSADDGGAIAEALLATASVPSSVISRHPARGAVASANDAVAASGGDLLVLLDADDRLSDTYLGDLEEALAIEAAGFAYARERLFGDAAGEQPARPFVVSELLCENFVNVSAMFRRELFERTGGFRAAFESLGFEDWDFWVSATECGFAGVPVQTCWLEYRRHPGGSRNTRTRFQTLRVHLRMVQLHPSMRRADVARWASRALWRTARGRSSRHRRRARVNEA